MFTTKLLPRAVTIVMVFVLALGSVHPAYAAAPENDDFANAEEITFLPFSGAVDISGATTELNEPQPYYYSPYTVWYSFIPVADAVVIADMSGTSFSDNVLWVYWAGFSGFDGLNFLGYTVYGGSVTFSVEAGTLYYIQAGSLGSFGDLHVNLQVIPPPLNDDFTGAKVILSELPFDDSINTVAATREGNEPYAQCAQSTGDRTVWYAFTPAENGSISASVLGSSFYPKLAVYTGDSLDSLTEAGCSVGWSVLTFWANVGTTYYIQAGGYYDGTGGEMQFHLEASPPPVASIYFYPNTPSIFDSIQFYDNSYDPGQVGIESQGWDFGDGTTATGCCVQHRYGADGDYTVFLAVRTFDGREASTSQIVEVRTHDVSITKVSAPQSANSGQTRSIAVYVNNKRYSEYVRVDLYKSAPGGFEWVGVYTQFAPVRPANRTTAFTFNYTFTKGDASIGKVTFKAVASIVDARDVWPADNELISSPPTKVTR